MELHQQKLLQLHILQVRLIPEYLPYLIRNHIHMLHNPAVYYLFPVQCHEIFARLFDKEASLMFWNQLHQQLIYLLFFLWA